MVPVGRLRRTINDSSELSKLGENQQALKLLDGEIAQAIRENRKVWICVLSRHAAVIADQMGDLRLVRQYRELCLAHDPDNPLTLLSLADVASRQGESDLAKRYAARSYELSVQRGTELDRAVIESIIKQWPEVEKL